MTINDTQIREIIVNILLECIVPVDNISVEQWIKIIKYRFSEAHRIDRSEIDLDYRNVLNVLNELVSGSGYFNVITGSNYVKDTKGSNKCNFFYT